MHTRSESRRRAKLEPIKLWNFREQSKAVELKINVIVDVALVCVGTDKKLILSLCPAHGCFIADLVSLLRCHFSGRERLSDLKKQGPMLYVPACFRLVLALYQQKLGGSCSRIAEV